MRNIARIAAIALCILPLLAMGYTITVTNPNSSTNWCGVNNSETIVWSLSPDDEEIDSFYIYWQENKWIKTMTMPPRWNYHDEEIPIGPECWKVGGDLRCACWTVTSCIDHVPSFPYTAATVTVEAWDNGSCVATDTSDPFIINNDCD